MGDNRLVYEVNVDSENIFSSEQLCIFDQTSGTTDRQTIQRIPTFLKRTDLATILSLVDITMSRYCCCTSVCGTRLRWSPLWVLDHAGPVGPCWTMLGLAWPCCWTKMLNQHHCFTMLFFLQPNQWWQLLCTQYFPILWGTCITQLQSNVASGQWP